MNNSFDLIVIGGGILGSFHAYHALKSGLKVGLFEKNESPQDATVRNFGQIVPSGMNAKWQKYGRLSLAIYKEIQTDFDISLRQNGTIYLASDDEESLLLEELAAINKANDYQSILYTKKQCLRNYPGLREDYVSSGLFFPEEVTIEPRIMINRLHAYMIQYGLKLFLNQKVSQCESYADKIMVNTTSGATYQAAKAIVCSGSDFKSLYPSIFLSSDLEISKLQMMQTKPQGSYKLKGSVLSGLSIRRYESFKECPSYTRIAKRQSATTDLIKKWGIHILFKQAIDGSIIIGDSHEYVDVCGTEKLGYELNMDIDNEILKEAKRMFNLPNYDIHYRWAGCYSQCKKSDIFNFTPEPNIHIVTGIGGKGMTGSAGYSLQNISELFNL